MLQNMYKADIYQKRVGKKTSGDASSIIADDFESNPPLLERAISLVVSSAEDGNISSALDSSVSPAVTLTSEISPVHFKKALCDRYFKQSVQGEDEDGEAGQTTIVDIGSEGEEVYHHSPDMSQNFHTMEMTGQQPAGSNSVTEEKSLESLKIPVRLS